MLIEKKEKVKEEVCHFCGIKLEDGDYFYRRKTSIIFYQCSNCGFYGFYGGE